MSNSNVEESKSTAENTRLLIYKAEDRHNCRQRAEMPSSVLCNLSTPPANGKHTHFQTDICAHFHIIRFVFIIHYRKCSAQKKKI